MRNRGSGVAREASRRPWATRHSRGLRQSSIGSADWSTVSAGHPVRALLRRTVSKAWHDRILGLSAEAAFWQLLSLPPLILASIASLGYVANWFGPDTVSRVQTQIEAALSRGFSSEFASAITNCQQESQEVVLKGSGDMTNHSKI